MISARPALVMFAAMAVTGGAVGQRYVGVNLAGAEFKSDRLPGRVHHDYVYPTSEVIDYFLTRNMNVIRLPFRWERLQHKPGGEFDSDELARIDAVVDHVAKREAFVILDPHNYARFRGAVIGSDELPAKAFTDLWRRLADHYRNRRNVIFGLMNEPHDIDRGDWFAAVQDAIDAIRTTGARNLVLVPGTDWTGAHSWFRGGLGPSNAAAFDSLNDPADNLAVEVHQYFDRDYSGTSPKCISADIGVEKLAPVTKWLRERSYRGFLGEFGASGDPVCLAALDAVLSHLSEHSDVWLGWTYWAGGAWWGKYPFSVSPIDGVEKPQMRVLRKYAERSGRRAVR